MKWQLVNFLLSTVISILFSWHQQQKIQFLSNMLTEKEVKFLFICLINFNSCFSKAGKTEVYLHQTVFQGAITR